MSGSLPGRSIVGAPTGMVSSGYGARSNAAGSRVMQNSHGGRLHHSNYGNDQAGALQVTSAGRSAWSSSSVRPDATAIQQEAQSVGRTHSLPVLHPASNQSQAQQAQPVAPKVQSPVPKAQSTPSERQGERVPPRGRTF